MLPASPGRKSPSRSTQERDLGTVSEGYFYPPSGSASDDGGGGSGARRRLPRGKSTAQSFSRSEALGRHHKLPRSIDPQSHGHHSLRGALHKSVKEMPRLTREDLAQIAAMMSSAKNEAAVAAAQAADQAVHGANAPLSDLGKRWLEVRRRVPRFMLFPALMLALMAACCTWVLPITFQSVKQAEKTVIINTCYMMYSSLPPYDNASMSTTMLLANASQGCFIDGEQVEPSKANFRTALVDMEPEIVATITQNDTQAAAYWDTQLPELRYLGCLGTLKPRGKINPTDGIMNLIFTWMPAVRYPLNVPMSKGEVTDPSTNITSKQPFVITWHVQCNDGHASCTSNDTCGVLLVDCNTDLVAEEGNGLSLYPWDRYYFMADISVHAVVYNPATDETHRVGVPMLFQFEQSTNSYYIHQEFDDQEVRSAGYDPMSDMYLFPAKYDEATSNSIHLVNVFKMRRSAIVIAWSMFVVLMMWFLSVGMLLTVLDLYWRPRSMYNGMQYSAIGLLWTIVFVRGTQPDVPPIGIVIDIAGFLWNWLFVAIAALICMGTSYEQYRHGDNVRKEQLDKAEKQVKEHLAKVGEVQGVPYAGFSVTAATTPMGSHLPPLPEGQLSEEAAAQQQHRPMPATWKSHSMGDLAVNGGGAGHASMAGSCRSDAPSDDRSIELVEASHGDDAAEVSIMVAEQRSDDEASLLRR